MLSGLSAQTKRNGIEKSMNGETVEEGESLMNVKGFILEDDQGREFVMGCEQPHAKLGRMFLLRGWQRRRLVPLQYSEREGRHIVREVLIALNDLFGDLLMKGRDRTEWEPQVLKSLERRKLPLETTQRCKA